MAHIELTNMKTLKLLPFLFLFISCDTKKESIIDSQKLINNQIVGLADSLNRVSDTGSIHRIRFEIHTQQLRFDSLSNELKKLNK